MKDDPGKEPRSPRGSHPRVLRGGVMKIVRRAHMYLGLLLFPWILMFGVSGMLFNHPEIGRPIEQRTLSREELSRLAGIEPWNPDELARQVVEKLNAASPAGYALDAGARSAFHGWPLLAAPSREGGRHVLILSLDGDGAVLSTHAPEPGPAAAPFAGSIVEMPDRRMAAVQEQVKDILPKLGIDAPEPPRAHPKIHPELRFRMRDAGARAWNVTYDLTTGRLDGRLDSGEGQLRFVELLEKLHTTHHYPVHRGMSWLWALFADLTGVTLVLWALSGLVMWWQMKPTRVIGVTAITIAVAVAAFVMRGTASEIQFGNVEQGGP